MSASISNDSGARMHYDFEAITAVQLNGNLPVPEPEILTLVLIGPLAARA
jgi:hypothetical protein